MSETLISQGGPVGYVFSYLNLRRIVGVIGILLPVVLRVGVTIFGLPEPYSVSGYYYSPMRNVLVASLCVLGIFLIAYRGYDRLDSRITNVAGGAAIGVAFFPTSNPLFSPAWVGRLHPYFAAVAILSLALMALQFTRSQPADQSQRSGETRRAWLKDIEYMGRALLFRYEDRARKSRKNVRNHIYSACAWAILVGVVLAFLQNFWPESAKNLTQWVYWFESLAIVAFGFSWLVKGGAMLADAALAPAEDDECEEPDPALVS